MSGDEGVGYRLYDEDEFLATGLLGETGPGGESWPADPGVWQPARRSAWRAVLAAVVGAAVGLAIVMTLRVIVGGGPSGSGHPIERASSHGHAVLPTSAVPRREQRPLVGAGRHPEAAAGPPPANAWSHRGRLAATTRGAAGSPRERSPEAPGSAAQPEGDEFGFEP